MYVQSSIPINEIKVEEFMFASVVHGFVCFPQRGSDRSTGQDLQRCCSQNWSECHHLSELCRHFYLFGVFFFSNVLTNAGRKMISLLYIDIGIIVFEQLHLMCRVTLCIRASAGLPDTERIRQPGASWDDHAGCGRCWGQHLQETQRGWGDFHNFLSSDLVF